MQNIILAVKYKLLNFHRKLWMFVLRFASNRLSTKDVTLVLDEIWMELLKQRIASLSRTPDGIRVAEIIFLGNEGDAMDTSDRDMRDHPRDIRDDRVVP